MECFTYASRQNHVILFGGSIYDIDTTIKRDSKHVYACTYTYIMVCVKIYIYIYVWNTF